MNFPIRAFEKAGFRYYEFGTLKEGGRKVADYYKGDLTPTIREHLTAAIPEVYFMTARPQYAPELVSSLVCIPTRRKQK